MPPSCGEYLQSTHPSVLRFFQSVSIFVSSPPHPFLQRLPFRRRRTPNAVCTYIERRTHVHRTPYARTPNAVRRRFRLTVRPKRRAGAPLGHFPRSRIIQKNIGMAYIYSWQNCSPSSNPSSYRHSSLCVSFSMRPTSTGRWGRMQTMRPASSISSMS